MDIELLRTFLEVNRARHFGEAASALDLTQAAVSSRIKNLETILGVRLFDRSRRGVRPTSEGTRLVRHADLLIAEWRKARQDVTAPGEQLSVGGSPRLWDVLLQDWLHALRATWPDLSVIAESHTPEVLTRRLLDGVLDLAFMLEPAQVEQLQIRPVRVLKLVLVSTRRRVSTRRALEQDYVMVDWGFAHALQHRRLFPDAPESRTRLGNPRMALAYLLQCGGAAYLPERMVREELRAGLLHRVAGAPVIERHAYAVFPLRGGKQRLVVDVLGLLRRPLRLAMPGD